VEIDDVARIRDGDRRGRLWEGRPQGIGMKEARDESGMPRGAGGDSGQPFLQSPPLTATRRTLDSCTSWSWPSKPWCHDVCLVKVEPVEHISRASVPDGDAIMAVPRGEAERAVFVVIVSSRDGMLGGTQRTAVTKTREEEGLVST
jgi:hypothetical protein